MPDLVAMSAHVELPGVAALRAPYCVHIESKEIAGSHEQVFDKSIRHSERVPVVAVDVLVNHAMSKGDRQRYSEPAISH